MQTPNATLRILIVDDEAPVRYTLRRILDGPGRTIVEACNGIEGLREVDRQSFDLVISDIIMPEMEGIEMIATLRGRFPHLPIVALSGGGRTSSEPFLELARRIGADLVMPKPIEPRVFLAAVLRLLGAAAAQPAADPSGR